MRIRLPRMDREMGKSILFEATKRQQSDGTGEFLTKCSSIDRPEGVSYEASGGTQLSDRQLATLVSEIEAIAREYSWPEQKPSVRNAAAFDARLAEYLATNALFETGEAHRDDVWTCLSVHALPHLVSWRFGNTSQRYLGGPRNMLQRLWIRGKLLDRGADAGDGRWRLLQELSEDALTGLAERPSIAGDRLLAIAIAEGWVRSAERIGRPAMESVMRSTIVKIRILNELSIISLMKPDQLCSFIDQQFIEAEESFPIRRVA